MDLKHTLSFQLYSSREFPPVDRQLSELAALSYTNVEPYDNLYADPEAFAAALRRNGLSAESGHFSLSVLEEDPERAVTVARRIGMSLIAAPWLEPEDRPTTVDGWKAFAARLSALAARFAADGLRFAWHNHDFEFVPLADGSVPIEHILGGADVGWEIDVAWVVKAGQDPLIWLHRYADRIIAVHMKDMAPEGENLDQDGWADIGEGTIDWKALWPAVEATRAVLVVIEHDNPKDWLKFARRSADAVNRIIKA